MIKKILKIYGIYLLVNYALYGMSVAVLQTVKVVLAKIFDANNNKRITDMSYTGSSKSDYSPIIVISFKNFKEIVKEFKKYLN